MEELDGEFADDECVDGRGDVWPEHDFNSTECRRCGAEPAPDPDKED